MRTKNTEPKKGKMKAPTNKILKKQLDKENAADKKSNEFKSGGISSVKQKYTK